MLWMVFMVVVLRSISSVAGQCTTVPAGDCTITLTNPQSSYNVGDRARYECVTGYHIEGKAVTKTKANIRCVGDGSGVDGWSKARPNCEKVNCGTPPDGTDTTPVPTSVDLFYDQSYVYTCPSGYDEATLGQDMVTTCQVDGTFSLDPAPTCVVQKCPALAEGTNTEPVDPSGLQLEYTQSYTYECLPGFNTTDELCTVCLEGGVLSEPAPTCQPIECVAPQPGTNTKDIPPDVADGMDYLQSYTYECNTGFNTSDPVCVVCQPNGVLSIDPPTCAEITCPAPTKGAKNKALPNNVKNGMTYLQTYTAECKNGFSTDQEQCTVCRPDGTLTVPDLPDCVAIECPAPGPGTNTEPVPGTPLGYQDTYTYTCLPGFTTDDELCTVCKFNGDLSADPPTCNAITCTGPNNGTNTVPVPAMTMAYLETYTYECLDGYSTDADLCVVCQPNGTLSSDTPPTCEEIVCPGLQNGVNTVPVPNDLALQMKYLQTYNYECEEGFSTDEQTCVTCQPNGTLSLADPPVCAAITCPGPAAGDNTNPIPADIADGMSYLQLYNYSCIPGYETTDEVCVFCRPDGTLSLQDPPECVEIPVQVTCTVPPGGTNTEDVPADLTIVAGTSFTYNCEPGFSTEDETTLMCLADGTLSPEYPPNCTATVCPPVPPGKNTLPVPTDPLPYLQSYTYTCEEGYTTDDELCVFCKPDGELSIDKGPDCEEVKCNPPPPGVNTEPVPPDDLVFGQVYVYTCMPGYTTDDPVATVCQADGTLSLDEGPNCTTKIMCGRPKDGINTEPVCPDIDVGYLETYVYTCLPGYWTMDETCTVCLPDGTFSLDDPPNCTEIRCPGLQDGENTMPIYPAELKDHMDYLQTYTYQCIEGYQTDDELCVVCQPDGTLSMDCPPNCTAIVCPGLEDGENTKEVPEHLKEEMQYLQSYTYMCEDGYSTDEEICVFCQPDGTLSSKPPNCTEIMCPPLENGTNTVYIPGGIKLTELQVFTYECMDDFMTDDELCIVCRPDGTYSDSPPTCIPRMCDSLPAGTNTMAPPPGPQSVGFSYDYQCLSGYEFIPLYANNFTTTCQSSYEWSLLPPAVCTRECSTTVFGTAVTAGIYPGTGCVSYYFYVNSDPSSTMDLECDPGASFDLATCGCQVSASCQVP